MKHCTFTEDQIISILKEHEAAGFRRRSATSTASAMRPTCPFGSLVHNESLLV